MSEGILMSLLYNTGFGHTLYLRYLMINVNYNENVLTDLQ